MKFFDEKFLSNKGSYIVQTLIATVTVLIVLFILDALYDTTIIASLGASSFIAFTMPHADNSKPRFLIGGYIVGIIVGSICNYLNNIDFYTPLVFFSQNSHIFLGAIAVGLSIFIMVITNTEHPPAAALALGLVLNIINLRLIIVILIGITSITLVKTLLKPYLKNLL